MARAVRRVTRRLFIHSPLRRGQAPSAARRGRAPTPHQGSRPARADRAPIERRSPFFSARSRHYSNIGLAIFFGFSVPPPLAPGNASGRPCVPPAAGRTSFVLAVRARLADLVVGTAPLDAVLG